MATARVQDIVAAAAASAVEGRRTVPEALCAACLVAMPVSGVGLALMSERGPEGLVAATDERATTMEELQFSLGEGPCVTSSTEGRPVLQPDLRQTGPQRWPGFGPAALEAGIAAIFAFPLQVGRIRLGVLDLYRDTPGALTPDELTEALSFADAATTLLLDLQARDSDDSGLHPDLASSGHNMAEVHQATGMIAVQAAVGLAEALLLLRAHSFANERDVLAVSCDVVARQLRFDPEDGHHE
ncbi:MAG: GAF domain-containing protein [Nocardioides sp.]|nr:GAF domain-containing protein [Nocardioides sp.]